MFVNNNNLNNNDNQYQPTRFQVRLEDIIDFIFPSILQHPLTAGRLFAYGMYGPLDEDKTLRTGPRGSHKITVWELDEMCFQIEREDLISIYLHKQTDLGLLSIEEQESLISQADSHLKKAKGRAMLPQITKNDIEQLFMDLPRDSMGYLSFHDIQNKILQYRQDRIKNYKLVYPNLVSKQNTNLLPTQKNLNKSLRTGRVSSSVAPSTMFQSMKGNTNPDIIKQTSSYLNKHSFKITSLNQQSVTEEYSITSNVRLLREVEPKCPDPYLTENGQSIRPNWNDTCNVKGTHLGSLVKAIPSSSTWKRKVTLG